MNLTGTPSGPRKRIPNCFVIIMCQFSSKTTLFTTILLGLIYNLGFVTDAAPLILFEDSHFRGVRTEYLLDGPETCVNIKGKLNDFFSSVENTEAGSCFLLCEHEFCRGQCVKVTGSVTNLSALDFNDMVSSIKRCPSTSSTLIGASPSTSSSTPIALSQDPSTTTPPAEESTILSILLSQRVSRTNFSAEASLVNGSSIASGPQVVPIESNSRNQHNQISSRNKTLDEGENSRSSSSSSSIEINTFPTQPPSSSSTLTSTSLVLEDITRRTPQETTTSTSPLRSSV